MSKKIVARSASLAVAALLSATLSYSPVIASGRKVGDVIISDIPYVLSPNAHMKATDGSGHATVHFTLKNTVSETITVTLSAHPSYGNWLYSLTPEGEVHLEANSSISITVHVTATSANTPTSFFVLHLKTAPVPPYGPYPFPTFSESIMLFTNIQTPNSSFYDVSPADGMFVLGRSHRYNNYNTAASSHRERIAFIANNPKEKIRMVAFGLSGDFAMQNPVVRDFMPNEDGDPAIGGPPFVNVVLPRDNPTNRRSFVWVAFFKHQDFCVSPCTLSLYDAVLLELTPRYFRYLPILRRGNPSPTP